MEIPESKVFNVTNANREKWKIVQYVSTNFLHLLNLTLISIYYGINEIRFENVTKSDFSVL